MAKSFKDKLAGDENPALGFLSGKAKEQKKDPEATETRAETPKKGGKFTITPKGENRTAHVQMLMTPTLKEAGMAAARAHGISFSELMNQLLEQYIEDQEG